MRTAAALPLLLLAACSTATVPSPSSPASSSSGAEREIVLPVNESASLGEDFTLSFIAVSSDSRCPARVQCVWAGEATVVVGKSHPLMRFRPDTLTVRAGQAEDSTEVGPFVVKVVSLRPEPVTTDPVRQADYRATFAVRRR